MLPLTTYFMLETGRFFLRLYKSSRFTIRMKHYLQTGVYVSAFRELTAVVDEEERTILEAQNPSTEDDAFMLLEWASKAMRNINTN